MRSRGIRARKAAAEASPRRPSLPSSGSEAHLLRPARDRVLSASLHACQNQRTRRALYGGWRRVAPSGLAGYCTTQERKGAELSTPDETFLWGGGCLRSRGCFGRPVAGRTTQPERLQAGEHLPQLAHQCSLPGYVMTGVPYSNLGPWRAPRLDVEAAAWCGEHADGQRWTRPRPWRHPAPVVAGVRLRLGPWSIHLDVRQRLSHRAGGREATVGRYRHRPADALRERDRDVRGDIPNWWCVSDQNRCLDLSNRPCERVTTREESPERHPGGVHVRERWTGPGGVHLWCSNPPVAVSRNIAVRRRTRSDPEVA